MKPGFFKNEELAKVSHEGRLLYAGLWCLADRAGRLEDRPSRIRAELFPYQSIKVDRLLQELIAGGFLQRYVVQGRAYLHIPTFLDHQRPHPHEAESMLPAPPAVTCHDMPLTSPSDPDPVYRSGRKKDQRADARRPLSAHKVLEKLAHGILDDRDARTIADLESEMANELKTRAAQAHIPYDGRAVTKALDSARVQRARRA